MPSLIPLEEYLKANPEAQANGNDGLALIVPPEDAITEVTQPWVKRHPRQAAAGAALVLAAGFMFGSQLGESPETTPPPVTAHAEENPVKAHREPRTGATPKATKTPQAEAAEVTVPTTWDDCAKPLINLSVGATSGINVPVKLKSGSEVPVKFQTDKQRAPVYPQTTYYGSLAVAVCLNSEAGQSAFAVSDKTLTVDRDSFVTNGLFPDVNKAGNTNKETVQGLDAGSRLKANDQIGASEAARVDDLMLPDGKNHGKYGQTVDWMLRDQVLRQVTSSQGERVSDLLDTALRSQLKAANPDESYKIVFTGTYDSLAVAYEQATDDFVPVKGVSLVKPVVAATIITTKGQA